MLLVGDLHLTSAPRDAYRWRVFEQIAQAMRGSSELVLLGDLTDKKDNHPSELVNRICDELAKLRTVASTIHVLRGNHDGVDPQWPYFRFLGHLPKVRFYSSPTRVPLRSLSVLFLPHSRNPEQEWREVVRDPKIDVIFTHVTVDGATAENRQSLSGIPASFFGKTPVYAGDVHVPQKIGVVTYVGAPYPIRFGDSFSGRFIELSDKLKPKDIPLTNVRRLLLDVSSAKEFARHDFTASDQVKVRVHLEKDGDWTAERKAIVDKAAELGLDLVQLDAVREEQTRRTASVPVAKVTPDDILSRYCSKHRLPDGISGVGRSVLTEALKRV